MGNEDDTPINNQLIEYKLGELFTQNKQMLDKMDGFLADADDITDRNGAISDSE